MDTPITTSTPALAHPEKPQLPIITLVNTEKLLAAAEKLDYKVFIEALLAKHQEMIPKQLAYKRLGLRTPPKKETTARAQRRNNNREQFLRKKENQSEIGINLTGVIHLDHDCHDHKGRDYQEKDHRHRNIETETYQQERSRHDEHRRSPPRHRSHVDTH